MRRNKKLRRFADLPAQDELLNITTGKVSDLMINRVSGYFELINNIFSMIFDPAIVEKIFF